MKKQLFRKIIAPVLGLSFIFLSCNFSDNDSAFNPLFPELNVPVKVTADFSVDKTAPAPLQNILSVEKAAGRSATAGIPNTIEYFAEAVTIGETETRTVTVPTDDIDLANRRFSINLLTGHTWRITVGIKDTSIDKVILKDSYDKALSVNDVDVSHNFTLKPQITSGQTGKIHLEINVPASYSVSITDENNAYSDWNTNLTSTTTASGLKNTLDIASIPSGVYVLKIKFTKPNTVPFIATQTVTVYDNLTTNTWLSGGNALITDSGVFELSSTVIDAANEGKKIYYVDGTNGNDNNTGNVSSPLQKISRAVALINAVGNATDTYKIFVKDGSSETLLTSTQITIGASSDPRKVEIETYQTTPGDKLGSVTLTQSAPISAVVVSTGASLTISGNLVIDGNSMNCNGILSSGTLTMNGGLIKNCYQAGVSTNGGVFNLFGGTIQNNRGKGVFISTTTQFNIKGNVTVYNNCLSNGSTPSNIYIPNGKVINVVDSLNTSSKIGVTTQTPPTLTTPVTITSGFSTHNSGVSPGAIFRGDAYGISAVSGEAAVTAGGGAITQSLIDNVEISFSGASTIWTGTSQTVNITVKKNGTEVSSPYLTLDSLSSAGGDFNTSAYRSFSGNELTLLNSLVEGRYTATVSTIIGGLRYTDSKTFNVVPKEVEVSSGNFNTSTGLSGVFKSGRTTIANIRPLIASTHEVTQNEYEMYCTYGSTAANDDNNYEYPAYYVSWYDAIIYCNLRTLNDSTFGSSRAERLNHCAYALGGVKDPVSWSGINVTSGKYYGPNSDNTTWNGITFDQNADGWRLPTEAEWEYLARSGILTTTGQTDYSGSNTIDDVAWYGTNSGLWNHEVCTKAPNGLGLYDMSGNVFEWVWDWYTPDGNITTTTEYAGPESGSNRVGRSGGWDNVSEWCKVYARTQKGSSFRDCQFGFRVVRNAN